MNHQKKGSILCPNCRKLISIDEPRCPYCHTPRPGSWWKNNPLIRGAGSGDRFIKTILVLNITMYLISLLLDPARMGKSLNPFSFLSPGEGSLLLLGATGTVPIDRLHRWWSLLSANYLHGSLLHIFFNMMAFRQLSPLIIEEYGSHRAIIIYTIGGTAGFCVSYLAGVPLTIGASAAICSFIGAILYFGKSRGGAYGQAIYSQIGGWALGIFLIGFLPGINNWGHGGGFVAGACLGFLLGYREKKKENFVHKLISTGCIIATFIVLIWGILSGVLNLLLA